jgi:hypothetical protein
VFLHRQLRRARDHAAISASACNLGVGAGDIPAVLEAAGRMEPEAPVRSGWRGSAERVGR